MAKISVTSNSTTINVSYGDYYPNFVDNEKISFSRQTLMYLSKKENCLIITLINNEKWRIRHDDLQEQFNILKIDSVDGVTPTSLDHLYTMLYNLFV